MVVGGGVMVGVGVIVGVDVMVGVGVVVGVLDGVGGGPRVNFPILLAPFSANQIEPSDPMAMPRGKLEAVGIEYSVMAPDVAI